MNQPPLIISENEINSARMLGEDTFSIGVSYTKNPFSEQNEKLSNAWHEGWILAAQKKGIDISTIKPPRLLSFDDHYKEHELPTLITS